MRNRVLKIYEGLKEGQVCVTARLSLKEAVSPPDPGGICCHGDLVRSCHGDERRQSGGKALVGHGVTNSV